MDRKVTLCCGIPGSGKSTWARGIAKELNENQSRMWPAVELFSADDFFITSAGWKFDPAKIGEAHERCLRNFISWVFMRSSSDAEIAIVDNSNLSIPEWAPYIRTSQAFGASVEVRVFNGGYRSIHGVPPATMDRMRKKFDDLMNNEVCSYIGKNFSKSFPDVPIVFSR